MPREFSRSQRIADQMHKELANVLQQEMKDPRLGFMTVNKVDLGTDISCAKVYVTFLGVSDPQAIKEAVTLLKRAAGFLRSRLSSRMRMRTVPQLYFRHDESLARADRIARLVQQAVVEDATVGAHAGEETS
ncbi:MAG: 30S ribosome-binding factor RbfA [Kistimonas sp.]|nr:30S ribosome-binding factor RbfA [Kistimonas sp.]